MEHKKDSESLKKLVKAFENAEQQVNRIFEDAKDNSQFKANINRQSKINEFMLKESTKEWVQDELPKAFREGYKSVNFQENTPQKTFYNFNDSLMPYIDIGGKVHTTIETFQDDINKRLDQMQSKGYVTIEQVKKTIMDTVGSIPTIKYQNGANMPLSKYADMLARTSRIETANGGVLARCKDIDRDLVKYQALPNCCPRCQKFNNKVFSISGKDTRFPYLYGENGPFRDGYNITHPNCRCEINLFVEEFYQNELDNIIKESNTFTKFTKNDKLFDIYNKQQAFNRQYNNELVEYQKLKQYYGDKFPYKTIGGFRRASRNHSPTLRMIRNFNTNDINGKAYHKKVNYFLDEEREKAWRFDNKLKAHEKFLDATKTLWSKFDVDEKVAITRYTEDSYDYANALRDENYLTNSKLPEMGRKYIEKNLAHITEMLEKCELPNSITLRRAVTMDIVAEKYFGVPKEEFIKDIQVPGFYKDKILNDKSFVSTSASFDASYGASFDEGKPVILEIYAPKNAKGLYVEPFSYYGGNRQYVVDVKRGVSIWDGENDSNKPKREVEVLLQKDCDFRVNKMFWDTENQLHIKVDLIRQGENRYETE